MDAIEGLFKALAIGGLLYAAYRCGVKGDHTGAYCLLFIAFGVFVGISGIMGDDPYTE